MNDDNDYVDSTDPAWTLASPSKLAEALAKAQGEIKNVVKYKEAKVTTSKGNYSYRYADLAEGIETIKAALSKNGIAHVCQTKMKSDMLTLYSRLIHESGEFLESEWPIGNPTALIPIPGRPEIEWKPMTPQQIGSAMTYGRRYTLFGLVGIAAEDDDGAAASHNDSPSKGASTVENRFYDEAVSLIDSAPTSATLKEWWNSPDQKAARKDMLDTKAHANLLRIAKEKIAELEAAEKAE